MLKSVSGKRKKTEADHEEMARIEFVAGLYMNEDGPVIPARLLEAAVVEGARKSKLGKKVQAGVIVEKHATLIYDGPRTAKELFKNERFRLAVPVRVGRVRVETIGIATLMSRRYPFGICGRSSGGRSDSSAYRIISCR